jgi:Tol biopolymer transport system component
MARQGHQGVDLWTTEVETGKRELIAKNDASLPRWSFDATRLAYLLADRLVVRDMAGGDRTIGRSRDKMPPPLPCGWTPDGTAVVASWSDSSSVPFALTLWPTSAQAAEKPARVLIADPRANLWQGRFSPNGRWVSFVAESLDDPGRGHILIAPAAGAPRAQWLEIARDHEWPDKPRWSADGRTLYFVSRRPASLFNLWGVRFDPDVGKTIGQPFGLTHFDSPSRMMSPNIDKTELGIGPRRVLLPLSSVTGSIWMLDHVER